MPDFHAAVPYMVLRFCSFLQQARAALLSGKPVFDTYQMLRNVVPDACCDMAILDEDCSCISVVMIRDCIIRRFGKHAVMHHASLFRVTGSGLKSHTAN